MALAGTLFLVAAWFGWGAWQQYNTQTDEQAVGAAHERLARSAEKEVSSALGVFEKHVNSPGVIDAVKAGDMAGATRALTSVSPKAKQVQVAAPDLTGLYQQSSLDYIRLAVMEASLLEREGYVMATTLAGGQLAMATPVLVDGKVAAVAYSAIPAETLFSAARSVEIDERAYLALRMGNTGLIEHGDTLLSSNSEAQKDAIKQSRLSVISVAPDAVAGPFGLGLMGCLLAAALMAAGGIATLLAPKLLAARKKKIVVVDDAPQEPTLAEQIASEAMVELSLDAQKQAARISKPITTPADEPGEAKQSTSEEDLSRVDPNRGEGFLHQLGQSIGGWLHSQGITDVAVGHDQSELSLGVMGGLVEGLVMAGRSVHELGQAPTPMVVLAGEILGGGTSIVALAADDGRVELRVVASGQPLAGPSLSSLADTSPHQAEHGTRQQVDFIETYLGQLTQDSDLVRDVCVSVSGPYAGHLARALELHGARVSDGIDAEFGVRMSDNATAIHVTGSKGEILLPQQILKLLAVDLLDRAPGSDLIFDDGAAKALAGPVISHGGNAKVVEGGVANLHAALVEHGAAMGGDMDGHILFGDFLRSGPDGFAASLRLVDLLSYAEHADEILTP